MQNDKTYIAICYLVNINLIRSRTNISPKLEKYISAQHVHMNFSKFKNFILGIASVKFTCDESQQSLVIYPGACRSQLVARVAGVDQGAEARAWTPAS